MKPVKSIALETEIDGKTFVPILELCYMSLREIFGNNAEEDCTEFVEVYHNGEEEFGCVIFYFDIRIGFTLTLGTHCEFEISADGNRLNINQLALFDKLRSWGFLLKSYSLESIKEWYAKETNRQVSEFDDYDNHICSVVEKFVNSEK